VLSKLGAECIFSSFGEVQRGTTDLPAGNSLRRLIGHARAGILEAWSFSNLAAVKFRASYGIVLHLLDPDGGLERLVLPMGASIRCSIARIDEAARDDDKMTAEWITDDECDSIEEQLGLAFVAAQTYLTRVVSLCKRIHDWHEHETGSTFLLGIGGKKDEVLGVKNTGITPIAGTAFSAVEGLNAFANYFKHRDEWPHDWTELQRNNEKHTVAVIQAFGARPGSTGNLRQGYHALFGDDEYPNVGRVAETVETWTRAIRKAYEDELRNADPL
jgi:hypothetical protein